MTINTPPFPLTYFGDGSTVNFSIPWRYIEKDHVVATLRDANDVETIWVLGTDYTLSAANQDNGGTLTATTAPTNNETLVIDIDVPQTQESPLPLGGDFPSTTVELMVDLTVQRTAKNESSIERTFRVPVTDTQTGDDLLFPIDTLRASSFLAFDADGKPIPAAGTSADLGPVSAYINTLLDDIDAATARSTLDAQQDLSSAGIINTQGDIAIGNVSGAAARLPIGADKTVLGSDGTTLSWQTAQALGLLQIGQYRWVATNTVPAGWLLCDARAVSRTTYAALFAEIGTTYGVGDGSTTFNLPDGQERSLIGVGTGDAPGASGITLAEKAGERTHVQSEDEVGFHDHGLEKGGPFSGGAGALVVIGAGTDANTEGAGGAQPMQWLHPVLGANLLIFAGA